MEKLVDEGKVKYLGISNTSPKQIDLLYKFSKKPIKILQTRCYCGQNTNWIYEHRKICNKYNIQIQCYGIISLNRYLIKHEKILNIVKKFNNKYTPYDIIFQFVYKGLNAVIINGAKNNNHQINTYNSLFNFNSSLDIDDINNILSIGLEKDFSNMKVDIQFILDFDESIELFWIDINNDNKKVSNGKILKNGDSLNIQTYHLHKFAIYTINENKFITNIEINANNGLKQVKKISNNVYNNDEL